MLAFGIACAAMGIINGIGALYYAHIEQMIPASIMLTNFLLLGCLIQFRVLG